MSKREGKIKVKHLREAGWLKRDQLSKRIVLILALAIGIALWAFYTGIRIFNTGWNTTIWDYAFFFVLAIILGIFGNRYAKATTELGKYCRLHNIDKDTLKKYWKEHRNEFLRQSAKR